jgi:hypothetical protein
MYHIKGKSQFQDKYRHFIKFRISFRTKISPLGVRKNEERGQKSDWEKLLSCSLELESGFAPANWGLSVLRWVATWDGTSP